MSTFPKGTKVNISEEITLTGITGSITLPKKYLVFVHEPAPTPAPPPVADPRAITITPTSGPPGTFIKITAANWQPNDHFIVWATNNLYEHYQADPAGNINISALRIPQFSDTRGLLSYDIKVELAGGAYSDSKTFTITDAPPVPSVASISLEPSSGPVGSEVTIKGVGFLSNHAIGLYENDSLIGEAATFDDGSFIMNDWTIPHNIIPGLTAYTLAVFDGVNKVGQAFKVTP
jgi:hypothetical protein